MCNFVILACMDFFKCFSLLYYIESVMKPKDFSSQNTMNIEFFLSAKKNPFAYNFFFLKCIYMLQKNLMNNFKLKPMKTKSLLSLGIFLLFFLCASAQKTSIKGIVLDYESGTPLNEANIKVEPGVFGTTTDSKGAYEIRDVEPGTYFITVSYVGYETTREKVEVQKGRICDLEVKLSKTGIYFGEITIKAKGIQEILPYAKSSLLATNLHEDAFRDVGDYLRKGVPNVSAIKKGGTALDPVVRGFKFEQLNVHLDGGVRVEGGCPNRMDPVAAHVEPDDIEKIEVIKGPYVLRFGPSLGGLVNIVTTDPEPFDGKKFQIKLKGLKAYESNWNGTKDYLNIKAGNNRIFFNLSGSSMDYGNYESGKIDGERKQFNTQFRKYGYAAELGFKPLDNHELRFSYIISRGRNVKFPVLPMDERTDNTDIIAFDYSITKLNDLIEHVNLKIYNSTVEHVMDNKERAFGDTVAAVSAIDAINMGGRLEFKLNLENAGKFFVGADFENIDKDGDRTKYFYRMPPNTQGELSVKEEGIWTESNIQNLGFFAEYNTKINQLDIAAAFRIDMNSATTGDMNVYKSVMNAPDTIQKEITDVESSFTNVSFSTGATYHINEQMAVGLGFGRGVRSPGMVERFIRLLPVGFDRFDYLGNPQLEPEDNMQLDLNLNYMNEFIGGIYLNLFYSQVNNYISAIRLSPSDVRNNTAGVLGVKQFINLEEPANFIGFEFSYATPGTYNFGASLIAAYTQATFKEVPGVIKDPVTGQVTDATVFSDDPANEIPPLESTIAFHYKLFKGRLIPSASLRIVAEQSNVSRAFEEEITEGFTTVDFGLSYKHNNYLRVSGGIKNVFDEAYYEHLNRRVVDLTPGNFYEPGRVFYVNLIVNL
jgi:iron complex outermembrane recepter protein